MEFILHNYYKFIHTKFNHTVGENFVENKKDKIINKKDNSNIQNKDENKLSKVYTTKETKANKSSNNKIKNETTKNKKSKTSKKTNNLKKSKNNKIKKKDKTGILIGATSIISLLLIMVVVGELYLMDSSNSNMLSYNANVNGINVGGMELSKANEKLVSAFNEKAENFELNLNFLL